MRDLLKDPPLGPSISDLLLLPDEFLVKHFHCIALPSVFLLDKEYLPVRPRTNDLNHGEVIL
jgi:hypothetical protein